MRIVTDLDGTLCTNTAGKYSQAEPHWDMIKLINKMYDEGYYILISTARGVGKNNNVPGKAITEWYSFTQMQLDSWGVKYHELHLGKLLGDIYIDDRAFRVEEDGSSTKKLESFLRKMNNEDDSDT